MKPKVTRKSRTGSPMPIPQGVKPMLATLLAEPFDDSRYLYEIKWDGYRLISYKNGKEAKLESRGGLDYTKKYPPIAKAVADLKHDVVLDGEAVVLNPEGRPDFDALQKFNGQQSGVYYYVFDILWLDGKDLMGMPLVERKKILSNVIKDKSVIKFSDDFDNGLQLFEQVKQLGLEGIVAKKRNSKYQPDKRTTDWFKIPYSLKEEFVIGGWVESERRHFRTLLFGAYEGKKLIWKGHAGGGYKEKEMIPILNRLKALEIKSSPFANEVDYDGVAHWVKPELVANIRYATLTRSGKIRKPAIFQGFREDKDAEDVVVQTPSNGVAKRKLQTGADSNWLDVEAQKIRNHDEIQVEGCKIPLTNVDSELWKGVTKADLIQYYHSISKYILPHLADRPLSLHVKIKGPYAPGVYIKDMEGRHPECAEIFTTERKHKKAGKRNIIEYLVCNNMPTLLYIINLGCIDLNPWTSRTEKPEEPDFIIIDLDPSDEDFTKAIEAAQAAKEFFDRRKLKTFVKTSGKTGLHIYIPCSSFNFSESRTIAENICSEIHSLIPAITTTAVNVSSRDNKLYLDPNQNDYSDTVAAPYSVRPYKHPYVSTPIDWKELNRNLSPANFSIKTIMLRLRQKGDLFEAVLDKKIAARNNKILGSLL
ncbi:MAG TPA: DNA ligase D [Chryseolinea sp.]|nr:DNA ligase D [Chryseolinea sp.]